MVRRIACSLMVFACLNLQGQKPKISTPKRNTVFVDAGGQSVYTSISFDRLLNVDKKVKRSFTFGFGVLPLKNYSFVCVPMSYNFLFSKNNHHLDVGAGMTLVSETWNDFSYNLMYLSPKASYRYQRTSGGPFCKVSFVPVMLGIINYSFDTTGPYYNSIFRNTDGDAMYLWLGLGTGWTF
jgi:hypothetical protein